MSSIRTRAVLTITLAVLQAAPLNAADPPKIAVTPGTPNVWSMEQAHYLLNRLRANRDGLQTKKPGEDDLNPNAMNGIRLDALQQFFGAAVSFDQIGATQNKLALGAYRTASDRRNDLIAQADTRRTMLQAQEVQVIQLTQESSILKAKAAQAKDPAEIAALQDQIAATDAKLAAATSAVTTLRGQVAALTDAASGGSGSGPPPASGAAAPTIGGAPGAPTLSSPTADYAQPIKGPLLATTFDTLLKSTAANFGQPRLHASQFLDNFVQMQYEIVAKQLTTLRDEVGKGQRVVFLELPTSIEAAAHRKIPFVEGGEDRLAQAWWRLNKLYLAYERENSPCWIDGEDVYDGLQFKLGFKQGHDVDEVPKGLKGSQEKEDMAAATRESAIRTLQDEHESIKEAKKTIEKAIEDAPKNISDAAKKQRLEEKQRLEDREQLVGKQIAGLQKDTPETAVRNYIDGELNELRTRVVELRELREQETARQMDDTSALWAVEDQKTKFERLQARSADRASQVANLSRQTGKRTSIQQSADPVFRTYADTVFQTYNDDQSKNKGTVDDARKLLEKLGSDETAAETALEATRKLVRAKQEEIRGIEAAVINSGFALSPVTEYYSRPTQAMIAGLEQPCRQAQATFSLQEEAYHKELLERKSEKDKLQAVQEKILNNKTALARTNKDLQALSEQINENSAATIAADAQSRKLGREIASLKAQKSLPAAEIAKKEKQKKDIDDQILSLGKTASIQQAAKAALQNRETEINDDQTDLAKKRTDYQRRDREMDQKQALLRLSEVKFRDELEYRQMRIYAEFGGPAGIHKAFTMSINAPHGPKRNDSGMVRTLEIFPRQTALNVNSTHALVNTSATSLAMKFLFGLGGKVDYERMREKYDQFVQQEVFASGFGKGSTDFGWTFGPNPGTRVLNPGERTTYAALAIPSNATGLEMVTRGCSFHHNQAGLDKFPDPPDNGKIVCSPTLTTVVIGLPDRDSSGSFWVTDVRYTEVKPGQRATIVMRGLFSPETNVLVNGKRLTQVVGLGKPAVNMDSGAAEDAGSGVIWGSYEYVNEHYMTLSLNVPQDFKDSKFPTITLISPSRTATINAIPLVVNGDAGTRLSDSSLLVNTKPAFTLAELQVLDKQPGPPAHVTARLSGSRVSTLRRLWINGIEIERKEPVSDNLLLIEFDDPDTLNWNITAATGEDRPEERTSATLSIPNPIKLAIFGVEVSNVDYNKKGDPVSARLLITGSAFVPELRLDVLGLDPSSSTFIAANKWSCTITITDPAATIIASLTDGGGPPVSSGPIKMPKKPTDPAATDDPKGKTTVTETQSKKTVTEKQ